MTALIIDDEAMPAKLLATLVKRNFSEFTDITIALGAAEGIEKLNEDTFDVLFLDIEMPQMTGFELLEEVDLPSTTNLIFTTAYTNYALDAFKVNAVDYLVKPVLELELHKAIRKVHAKQGRIIRHNVISVLTNNEHLIIDENDILRLEADGSYTKIVTDKGTLVSSNNLKYNCSKLDSSKFYRCHNSHVVNTTKIQKVGKGKGSYIVLINEDVVPFSKSRFEGLAKVVGI